MCEFSVVSSARRRTSCCVPWTSWQPGGWQDAGTSCCESRLQVGVLHPALFSLFFCFFWLAIWWSPPCTVGTLLPFHLSIESAVLPRSSKKKKKKPACGHLHAGAPSRCSLSRLPSTPTYFFFFILLSLIAYFWDALQTMVRAAKYFSPVIVLVAHAPVGSVYSTTSSYYRPTNDTGH